jgi:ADP-ribose pyrophosphatase YjhB (NUDIX family)
LDGEDSTEDRGGKDAMSDSIRIRVCLAVVDNEKLLLVPHYNTDAGDVQWVVPGGKVEFGESLQEAATREFFEETGLEAEVVDLLHVSEVILPERPYHSITVSFLGSVKGGTLRAEADHPYGSKIPRWLSAAEVGTVRYHPERTVEKALGIDA